MDQDSTISQIVHCKSTTYLQLHKNVRSAACGHQYQRAGWRWSSDQATEDARLPTQLFLGKQVRLTGQWYYMTQGAQIISGKHCCHTQSQCHVTREKTSAEWSNIVWMFEKSCHATRCNWESTVSESSGFQFKV
jgi:hypothetical protein